jgi:hypothetical protein
VRLNARLYQHIPGLKFLDKSCYSEDKEIAVILNAERETEIVDKISRETQTEKFVFWNSPQIIAIGKFSRVHPTRESDSVVDNTYLHFEIIKVEKATN